VATFALIHGGGSSGWDWHLVAPALQARGHEAVAVDLPTEDESAGWWEYADAVADAVEGREDVVVAAHSLGGFTAPLVCTRRPVELVVFVAAMIPSPGERFDAWWTNAGYEESGLDDIFYHDVPSPLVAGAKLHLREEKARALSDPWPLDAWPDTPTRYLLCRDDRLFTPAFARRHARERLGVETDEIDGGHYIALARPRELAERLDAYVRSRPA
jgi:pimeloyl-ACP methyl ester carboxylesterase